jgi:hypothetical protein
MKSAFSLPVCAVLAVLSPSMFACTDDQGGRDSAEGGVNTISTTQSETSGDGDGDSTPGDGDDDNGDGDPTDDDDDGDGDSDDGPIPTPKWDVGAMPDSPDICVVPDHLPCDHLDFPNEEQRAWRALGLNCPGEYQAMLDFNGHFDALEVFTEPLGEADPPTYPILEGVKMVALSTGRAADLLMPGTDGDTTLTGNDPGDLPAPMDPNPVDLADTCAENESLVDTGDCSNTIGPQFLNTAGAFDYAEMRFTITVPEAVNGFAYNVAFLSWEYPDFYNWAYNDIYIAWLESEQWTGNITFDDYGNPLSLNAGFLDFKDAPNVVDCPPPCEAPELEGTGVQGHGATRWLETNTGVTAGETITVIFAIMDIQDNIVDSAVLLDNFHWTCLGGTPGTVIG